MESQAWRRRFTLFDAQGHAKPLTTDSRLAVHDIAGPLCFQGDYICKDVPLPQSVCKGDILVVHDTGAYTRALYSFYNSRPAHSAYSVVRCGEDVKLELIKKAQTTEEVLDFWT